MPPPPQQPPGVDTSGVAAAAAAAAAVAAAVQAGMPSAAPSAAPAAPPAPILQPSQQVARPPVPAPPATIPSNAAPSTPSTSNAQFAVPPVPHIVKPASPDPLASPTDLTSGEALGGGVNTGGSPGSLPPPTPGSAGALLDAKGRRLKPNGGVSRNGPAWTEFEDRQIMKLVAVHGRKWKIIAESIPNRTHDALRNRYERLLKITENGGSRSAASASAASLGFDPTGKSHIPTNGATFVAGQADMNQVLAIECVIPDAHKESQPICWPSPSGVLVEVAVPANAKPGQIMRFHIPSWLAADLGHKRGQQPPATGSVSPSVHKRSHDEMSQAADNEVGAV